MNRCGQWRKVLRPFKQVGLTRFSAVVLPSMVGGQIKFTGTAGNGCAASNAVEEFAFAKGAAHFANHAVEGFKAHVKLFNDQV